MSKILLNSCFDHSESKDRDKLIKQLLIEVQQQQDSLVQRNLLLAKVVDYILLLRPICRQFKGQPLTGVYQELYNAIRKHILHEIAQEIDKYNINNLVISRWIKRIENQTFKKILNDNYLKKLGVAAQQYPPQTELRSYALTELIRAIQLSGRMCRPHREKFSVQLYQLLYEEAMIETLTYICLNIDKYDPHRGQKKFMNWVNFRLDKIIFDCYRRFNYLPNREIPSIQDLENIKQRETKPFLSELVYQCIKDDVNNIFQTTHIKNKKNANFQVIALARFSGKSWEQISEELAVPIPTLSSFFQRCCQRFSDLMQKELQD